MGMAVEMNAAVVALVPNPLTVVKQNDELPFVAQFKVVLNAVKRTGTQKVRTVLDDFLIVVSQDKVFGSVESSSNPLELVVR